MLGTAFGPEIHAIENSHPEAIDQHHAKSTKPIDRHQMLPAVSKHFQRAVQNKIRKLEKSEKLDKKATKNLRLIDFLKDCVQALKTDCIKPSFNFRAMLIYAMDDTIDRDKKNRNMTHAKRHIRNVFNISFYALIYLPRFKYTSDKTKDMVLSDIPALKRTIKKACRFQRKACEQPLRNYEKAKAILKKKKLKDDMVLTVGNGDAAINVSKTHPLKKPSKRVINRKLCVVFNSERIILEEVDRVKKILESGRLPTPKEMQITTTKAPQLA